MFELLTPHKAKFIRDETLSQKNRPAEEAPGVRITLETTFSEAILASFAPDVHAWMFVDRLAGSVSMTAQAELDGIPSKPVARKQLNSGYIGWSKISRTPEMTGYSIELVRGTGRAASNIALSDCIVTMKDLVGVEPDQCKCKLIIEAGNVPDEHWHRFARLKSRECEIIAKPPEVEQRDLVAEGEARALETGIKASLAKARKPGPNDRAAVAKVKGGNAESPEGKPSKAAAAVSKDGAWPFPEGQKPDGEAPPQSVTIERSQPGTRTARGRDATKAFLDAQSKANDGATTS